MEKVISALWSVPGANTLEVYKKHGGYEAAKEVLSSWTPEKLIEHVKASGLRGRGGAGFPTGMKWSFINRGSPKPKYVCINADESEPGTAKDRYILELTPHLLIEGTLICAKAIDCHHAFIYCRGEFYDQIAILKKALAEAKAAGIVGKNALGSGYDIQITVHSGFGAYICGEETGLIESLEGKKGQPRIKPPFPAVVGLYNCPTVVNNVETAAALPWIIKHAPEEYKKFGTEKSGGTKLLSISGHVNKPGTYEIPLGLPLSEFINSPNYGGGVWKGRKLKACIPGGSSVPILTAAEVEKTNIDYESCAANGTMLGSGGCIVMDETTDMVHSLRILGHFYSHESCGQCTPCRTGTNWAHRILCRIDDGEGRPEDVDELLKIANNMVGRTICPLADALAMPIKSFLTKFRSEFDKKARREKAA
ncbi:MAG: NADH-quinone oxidoreductase subunit NuoF [Bdellovibrionota bacterium]